MKNLYKLSKEELVVMCNKLQKENNILRMELNNLSDCYMKLENERSEKVWFSSRDL